MNSEYRYAISLNPKGNLADYRAYHALMQQFQPHFHIHGAVYHITTDTEFELDDLLATVAATIQDGSGVYVASVADYKTIKTHEPKPSNA